MNLPDDCITRPYKDIKHFQPAAQEVLDGLARSHGGNQFIVLLNVPADTVERFETDKAVLGGDTVQNHAGRECHAHQNCAIGAPWLPDVEYAVDDFY